MTPSKCRRQGYEAYDGSDPKLLCPYEEGTSAGEDWIEGWKNAEKKYLEDTKEEMWVTATFSDGREDLIGFLEISENDMPVELEINGVIYYPQF